MAVYSLLAASPTLVRTLRPVLMPTRRAKGCPKRARRVE